MGKPAFPPYRRKPAPHSEPPDSFRAARKGNLVDDFLLVEGERMLHVLNAPSPAATASLAIGRVISERAEALLAR